MVTFDDLQHNTEQGNKGSVLNFNQQVSIVSKHIFTASQCPRNTPSENLTEHKYIINSTPSLPQNKTWTHAVSEMLMQSHLECIKKIKIIHYSNMKYGLFNRRWLIEPPCAQKLKTCQTFQRFHASTRHVFERALVEKIKYFFTSTN